MAELCKFESVDVILYWVLQLIPVLIWKTKFVMNSLQPGSLYASTLQLSLFKSSSPNQGLYNCIR